MAPRSLADSVHTFAVSSLQNRKNQGCYRNQTAELLYVKYSNDYLFCLHSRYTSLNHQKCNQKAKVECFSTEIVLTKYVILICFFFKTKIETSNEKSKTTNLKGEFHFPQLLCYFVDRNNRPRASRNGPIEYR